MHGMIWLFVLSGNLKLFSFCCVDCLGMRNETERQSKINKLWNKMILLIIIQEQLSSNKAENYWSISLEMHTERESKWCHLRESQTELTNLRKTPLCPFIVLPLGWGLIKDIFHFICLQSIFCKTPSKCFW